MDLIKWKQIQLYSYQVNINGIATKYIGGFKNKSNSLERDHRKCLLPKNL